jgi:hypothetical protein
VEQDTYSINSAVGSKSYPQSTLVVPARKDVPTTQTQNSGTKVVEVSNDWRIMQVPPQNVQVILRPPVIWSSGHPSISEFVRKAALVAGVRCIVVEDVDEKIIHLTTFADPVTEETQRSIYAIEAATIDAYPDLVFDFHLRVASETESGTPIAVPGQRFFAIWGNLDEKPANPRQAGRAK